MKKMKCSKKVLLAMAAAIGTGLLAGCSTKLSPEPFDANLRLTSGHVKTVVKKGKTTRLEVFKALGAPNVIAVESGKGETWTYDQMKVRRTAQGYGAGAFFLTGFAFSNDFNPRRGSFNPGSGIGEAGVSASGSVGTNTTSINTATLVIRFDASDRVQSYKMLVTSF
jgi:outer membrane protein assembly factor BamE (lipoprotein component of BamABCDE complex)